MSAAGPLPLQWEINGLKLAGLSWGKPGDRPLLALHGWLDNAASFSLLAPLMTGYHVVALDLTGHGQSDQRSPDATYQIWDDLPEILGVVDALAWDSFSLVGHSRGAIISSLFASAFPERIERLVLMDAVGPQPVPEQEFPQQMRKFLLDKQRLLQQDTRVFPTVDDAVSSRRKSGLHAAAAQLLVERNLRPSGGGFTWTTDPRLRGASAVKLTVGQNRAVLEGLAVPTLLLLAEDGLGRQRELAVSAERHVGNLITEQVSGGHHFHMETNVATVARRLMHFLEDAK